MVVDQYFPHIGGAERQISILSLALRGLGVRTWVLTRRLDPSHARVKRMGGVAVVRLGPAVGGILGRAAGGMALAIFLLTRRRRWQVLHVHGQNPFELGAAVAGRLCRVPVLVKITVSDFLLPISTANYSRFAPMSHVKRQLAGRGRRLLLRLAHVVVALNEEIERTARRVGARRVERIPNGIATELFPPASPAERQQVRCRFGLSDTTVVFLYSGRITPQKNLELLLEAWDRFIRARAGVAPVCLWLLGVPDNPEYCRRVAIRAEGTSSVQLLGRTDDPRPYYRAADVFVLPSLREGISNALLEALSSGLLVVASDIPGNRAVVNHLPGTWLCAPLGPDAFVSAFAEAVPAARSRSQATRLAQHHWVGSRFGISETARSYLSLYQELTSKAS